MDTQLYSQNISETSKNTLAMLATNQNTLATPSR